MNFTRTAAKVLALILPKKDREFLLKQIEQEKKKQRAL